jgi:hypothetical protein
MLGKVHLLKKGITAKLLPSVERRIKTRKLTEGGNNYGIYNTVLYTQKYTGTSEEVGGVGIYQKLS